jgi:hypothetical protein
MSSYQHKKLTKEKDQKDILIIGGIQIFLPGSPVEARVCVVDVAAKERQLAETIKEEEEMEKTLMFTQEKGNEHSEEWLNIFSQEAEKETSAALKLIAGEEHGDKLITPWEMELEMLEDWMNNPEPVDDYHEQTVNLMIAEDEHSEELLRNFSQGTEQVMKTAMSRHATIDKEEYQPKE